MSSRKAQLCVCEKCAYKVEECHVHQQLHILRLHKLMHLGSDSINAQKVFVTVIIITRYQDYNNFRSVKH